MESIDDTMAKLNGTRASWELTEPLKASAKPMTENRRWDKPQHHVTIVPSEAVAAAENNDLSSAAAAAGLNISFLMQNATTTTGDPPAISNKVKILDGKVNDDFPIGMGSGNYIFDIDNPADATIWVGVTFDPTTLAITSRFLQESTAGDAPESRVDEEGGFLYWKLGFTYFDAKGTFRIWQTLVGDVNFALTYVAYNGKPALLPVISGPGYLDLDSIIPP